MTFNLTEKRVECLRWLAQQTVPVPASAIANNCLTRGKNTKRGGHYSRQQATRTGAGYARPLAEAGLVRCVSTTYGWGDVTITNAGRAALASFDREDGTLDLVLADARESARRNANYWWEPKC